MLRIVAASVIMLTISIVGAITALAYHPAVMPAFQHIVSAAAGGPGSTGWQ
jgi:hypothetical protein